MKKLYFKNKVLLSLLMLLVFQSCRDSRNHPGYDYFPDMFYSEAYESYSENPVFDDGSTMREPVEGTIPRDIIPFQFTNEEGERERAGEELTNPFAGREDVLDRGEQAYDAFCGICHGEDGKGEGYLHSSGLYAAVPRDLTGEVAESLRDGEIYHTISLGFGSMGPHKSQIRPEDRWKIVSYIRQVLQNNMESTSQSEQ